VKHIFSVPNGEVATTIADTVPGPSLANENVRADPAGSTAESSIKSLNVRVAVGEVWDGIGEFAGSTEVWPVGTALDDETSGL
jgi:hypothetical protein